MLTIARKIVYACACAIAVGFSFPLAAQTEPSTTPEFGTIEVGEDRGWEFKSENESISIEDDLGDLQDYSISDSEDSDVRLIEENRRWNNRGNTKDYSIETEIYDY